MLLIGALERDYSGTFNVVNECAPSWITKGIFTTIKLQLVPPFPNPQAPLLNGVPLCVSSFGSFTTRCSSVMASMRSHSVGAARHSRETEGLETRK